MKKLICAVAVLFISISSFAQSFEKFEREDNVSKVSMSKSLFSLIGNLSEKENLSSEDKKVVDFINRITSFKMYSTSDTNLRSEMKSIAKKFKKSKEFEELMRINDGGKEVEFLVKSGKNDEIKELIMFVEGSGKNESVVFQLKLS